VGGFEALPGRGSAQDRPAGRLMLAITAGSRELGLCSSDWEARCRWHERQGRSLSLLAE